MKSLPTMALVLLCAATASAQGICENITGLWIEEDEVLRFEHFWEDNCAVDQITYEVVVAGSEINVIERASAFALAMCFCPYSGAPEVGGLAPGDYTVVWDYYFTCDDDPQADFWLQCDTFTVTVPEHEPLGDPGLTGYSAAGCGIDITAVPDPPLAAPRSLSTVRARFH
jgi:hypothetical protein